ncbi:MAG: hypothetical protein ACI9EH_000728, partial [Planktomarina sp.]
SFQSSTRIIAVTTEMASYDRVFVDKRPALKVVNILIINKQVSLCQNFLTAYLCYSAAH